MSLEQTMVAEHSFWIAARAFGKRVGARNTVIGQNPPGGTAADIAGNEALANRDLPITIVAAPAGQ